MTRRSGRIATLVAAMLATGSAEAAAPQLVLSYSQQSGNELPLFVTADGGYFAAHGVDVTLSNIPAQQGIPALMAHQVQIIALGGPDVLSAAAQGVRLTFFASYAPADTYQFWARPEYATPAKLKGQKVASTSNTGASYVATVLSLKELGLTLSDVAMTPLGTLQNTAAALIAGSVAAMSSVPPSTVRFEKLHYVKMVDLAARKIPTVSAGLFAETSFVAAHRPEIQAVVDALIDGLKRMKTDKAITEHELRTHLQVTDQATADLTYAFFATEVAPDLPLPQVDQLAVPQGVLAALNPKVKEVDVAAMVDQSFVKEAAARMGVAP